MKTALAIDIGGTKIYSAIINEKGEFESEVEKHGTPQTLEEIKSLLYKIVKQAERHVDTIAIATAGAVNNENTFVISSTGNLPEGYNTINFPKISSKVPVFVENDANAAAWAEYKVGSSKNCPNSITLTLGTGVGGGIILGGKLFKGKSGAAGEMHFRMYPDKRRRCTCGAFDCFESYASGTGLELTAQEILQDFSVTSYDVIQGVQNNDARMVKVFDKWINDIKTGLCGLANLFDPDCIILSGSMAQFVNTDYLTDAVNAEIVTTPTKILKAQAGNYSGMIGAALLALERLK